MKIFKKPIAFTVLYKYGLVKIINFFGNIFFISPNIPAPITKRYIERILVFRTGTIGDVLMTTPFIHALRIRFPNAHITYLVGKWAKEAIRGNPSINELIVFDERIFFDIRRMPNIIRLIFDMRKGKFDVAFILDISFVYSAIAYLAGIPIRVGLNRNGEGFILTHKVEYVYMRHHVNNFLSTLSFFGVDSSFANTNMEITVSKDDEEYASKLLSLYNLSDKDSIIGIAPGGAKNPGEDMPLRQWPLEHYEKLVDDLWKQFGAKIILIGSGNDRAQTEKLEKTSSTHIINLAGKTTIKQAASVIGKCDLFITHDSGLMHLAAASGTPTISIFGPTEASEKAPIGREHVFIRRQLGCSPCYKDGIFPDCESKTCLEMIKPYDILSMVKIFLINSKKGFFRCAL